MAATNRLRPKHSLVKKSVPLLGIILVRSFADLSKVQRKGNVPMYLQSRHHFHHPAVLQSLISQYKHQFKELLHLSTIITIFLITIHLKP